MILEDHPPGKLARCTKSQQCSPSSQSQTLLLFLIAMVMVGMIKMIKKKTMKKEQRWRWKLRNKPMLDLTSIQVLQGMEKFQLEVEELLSPLYLCTFEFVLLCIMWKYLLKQPLASFWRTHMPPDNIHLIYWQLLISGYSISFLIVLHLSS